MSTENLNVSVSAADEIEQSIMEEGTVEQPALFRRWVAAQVCRHLNDFDEAYLEHGKPFKYVFQTLISEIKTLRHLKGEEKTIREYFWNINIAKNIVSEYTDEIRNNLNNQLHRNLSYNTLNPNNNYATFLHYDKSVLLSLTNTDDINPFHIRIETFLYELNTLQEKIHAANDYDTILPLLVEMMCRFPMYLDRKPLSWKTAFRAAGAYYTLENLIRFGNIKHLPVGVGYASVPATPNTYHIVSAPAIRLRFTKNATPDDINTSLAFIKKIAHSRFGSCDYNSLFSIMKATVLQNTTVGPVAVTMR